MEGDTGGGLKGLFMLSEFVGDSSKQCNKAERSPTRKLRSSDMRCSLEDSVALQTPYLGRFMSVNRERRRKNTDSSKLGHKTDDRLLAWSIPGTVWRNQ